MSKGEKLVISGMSGKLPECNNLQEFKENLFTGKDMVTENNKRWKSGNCIMATIVVSYCIYCNVNSSIICQLYNEVVAMDKNINYFTSTMTYMNENVLTKRMATVGGSKSSTIKILYNLHLLGDF